MADPKIDLSTYYGRRIIKEYLYKLQAGICVYCESLMTLKAATIDHVVPVTRGGSDAIDNLVGCCIRCNKEKGERTLAEFAPWLADVFEENAAAEQATPLPAIPQRPSKRPRGNGALNTPFNGLAAALSARGE